jgi:hypothetical protein
MNLTYLNIVYFLWYQKIRFLYNDVQLKNPKKSQGLSYLYPHLYKLNVLTPSYNNNIIVKTNVNTHVNTHINTLINTYVNKYIKK